MCRLIPISQAKLAPRSAAPSDGSSSRPAFFFQAEDGIRDWSVTGVQTCALPIYSRLQNRRAYPWNNRRHRALQGLIDGSGLREVSDLGRTTDIRSRWKERILHRRADQHIRAQRQKIGRASV